MVRIGAGSCLGAAVLAVFFLACGTAFPAEMASPLPWTPKHARFGIDFGLGHVYQRLRGFDPFATGDDVQSANGLGSGFAAIFYLDGEDSGSDFRLAFRPDSVTQLYFIDPPPPATLPVTVFQWMLTGNLQVDWVGWRRVVPYVFGGGGFHFFASNGDASARELGGAFGAAAGVKYFFYRDRDFADFHLGGECRYIRQLGDVRGNTLRTVAMLGTAF